MIYGVNEIQEGSASGLRLPVTVGRGGEGDVGCTGEPAEPSQRGRGRVG